jgi:hypothetical protein
MQLRLSFVLINGCKNILLDAPAALNINTVAT